jgi:hypothetical protein
VRARDGDTARPGRRYAGWEEGAERTARPRRAVLVVAVGGQRKVTTRRSTCANVSRRIDALLSQQAFGVEPAVATAQYRCNGTVKLRRVVSVWQQRESRRALVNGLDQAAAGKPTTSRHVRRCSARSCRRAAAGLR